jgi:hypothetical protein
MGETWNRRELMKIICGAAGGAATALVARADQAAPSAKPASATRNLPWPYQPLNPDLVAQRAFEGYKKAYCMYGPFEAIVGSVAERLGAPYQDFPFEVFKYGAGGVNGWATLCGALNGSAAALQMLSVRPDALIDALFVWYEVEELPNFHPTGGRFPEIRSVSGTPLCHTSISKWCAASGKKAYSPERAERCGAIAASVAQKAVLLLNEQTAGKPAGISLPAATQNCMSCHEKGGAVENTRTKMNCTGCHAPLLDKHP